MVDFNALSDLYDLCFPSKIALSFTSTDLTALECCHSQLFLLLLTPLLVPRNSNHTFLHQTPGNLQYLHCRCPISMVMTVSVQWPGCEAEPQVLNVGWTWNHKGGIWRFVGVHTLSRAMKGIKGPGGKSFTSQVRRKPQFCRGINKRKQNPTQLQPPEGDSRPGNQWPTLSVCKLFWLQPDSALTSQDNPLKGMSKPCVYYGWSLPLNIDHSLTESCLWLNWKFDPYLKSTCKISYFQKNKK